MATDIDALHFNKAVARIYELVSGIEKAAPGPDRAAAIRAAAPLVSPMMPHLAEELHAALGGSGLVAEAHGPRSIRRCWSTTK